MARTSTYLNFPNHTEEAFNFYKSVFGGEFNGGINRFKDIPADDNAPAMNDELKNLVMHVELPITGGHILMGTDAPEQMGFNVKFGNNIYINLEPDTREETKRLFNALSAGAKWKWNYRICSGELFSEVAPINTACNGCSIAVQNKIHY